MKTENTYGAFASAGRGSLFQGWLSAPHNCYSKQRKKRREVFWAEPPVRWGSWPRPALQDRAFLCPPRTERREAPTTGERAVASPSSEDEMEESGRDSWSTQGLEELREGSQVISHFPMDARRKTSVSNSSPRRFSKSLQFGHFPPVLQVRGNG